MSSAVIDPALGITRREKIEIILRLAVPAIVENILQVAVGFVDMLFVAKLGLSAVAAVSVSNTLIGVYIAIFMSLGISTASLIARSVGAGDVERAKLIARHATRIVAVVGLLLGVVTLLFAEPLLRMMGADAGLMADAAVYFRIIAIPSLFISLMFLFGSMLRAVGDTKTPMKVSLWMNVVHIALDYLLIFGLGSFAGFGIAGAAFATVLVRIVGAAVLFRRLSKSPVAFSLFECVRLPNLAPVRELVKLATPNAIERLVMRFGQVLYFGLIVRIGTDVFAAHTIAGNIEQFAYMPGYGLAIAASTLVGQSIGAKRRDDAYAYGMLTALIGVIMLAALGFLFLFALSPWLACWFTTDQSVVRMVVTALRIDAFALPLLGIALTIAGALQGLGDTKGPMYSTAIGMWLIRIAGVYVLCIYLHMGIAGIWTAIALDILLRAMFLFARFRKRFERHQSRERWDITK